MASTRRKSAALALAGIGIAGLSLASAAQLNVDSASLGAANEVVAACQAAADGDIAIDFSNAFVSGEYVVDSVDLSNIGAACNGLDYKITLTDSAGAALGAELSGSVSGTTLSAAVADISAEDIEGVAVIIYG